MGVGLENGPKVLQQRVCTSFPHIHQDSSCKYHYGTKVLITTHLVISLYSILLCIL